MGVKVKICGLTDAVAVAAVVAAGADYAGFVYYPASPRHVALEKALALKALLPASIPSVSVLVDADDALLAQAMGVLRPDFLQLHGKETPQRVAEIKKSYPQVKIIKAMAVRTGDDVAGALRYADVADMLMFDAKPPQLPGMLPGGNGLSFDWALLKAREFSKPWMLSGGLNPGNVAGAIGLSGAAIVDVSSGVESAPGVKDAALIHAFVKAARKI